MYRKICLLTLILTLIVLLLWLLTPTTVQSDKAPTEAILATSTVATTTVEKEIETPEVKPVSPKPIAYEIPDGLDPKTREILTDLIHCESRGNPNALNAVDRDGTASHGLLQFKTGTFIGAMKLVDPAFDASTVMTSIYDPNLQIKAFLAFYGDGKPVEWWKQQFPACSRLQGYWLDL